MGGQGDGLKHGLMDGCEVWGAQANPYRGDGAGLHSNKARTTPF